LRDLFANDSYVSAPAPAITRVPSAVPEPSAAPNLDNIIQLLSPYLVFYQIEQTRIPSISEYAQLATFTANYLNDYFTSIFAGTATVFLTSITNVTGSEFRLGQPVRVDYNTTIIFGFQSQMIPDGGALDALLASAFEGTNGEAYAAALLNGVGPSNIFSTTSTVSFSIAPAIVSESGRIRIALTAIVSLMSVLAFVGGTVIINYMVRREKSEKGSMITDDSSTVCDGTDDETNVTENFGRSSRYSFNGKGSLMRYSRELQTAMHNVESEAIDMRVASSVSEKRSSTTDTNVRDDQNEIIIRPS
jgi:hypothetical protein